jgi:uncharacterized protein (DUF2147 family)
MPEVARISPRYEYRISGENSRRAAQSPIAKRCCAILATLVCAQMQAVAIPPADWMSPVGRWTTFDDRTGKARAIVQIYEEQGEFFGRIESTLMAAPDTRVCISCTDDRKNQPIIGLVVMRHVRFEDGEYRGGTILDPDTGAIYRCKLKLEDGGARLVVRGFVGIALFGRSQTWRREK